MVKSQKLILSLVCFFVACAQGIAPRVKMLGPKPPPLQETEMSQLVKRLQNTKQSLSDLLDKSRTCLRNQTCSRAVLKKMSGLAGMLAVLSAYAYVGTKAVQALRKDLPERKPPLRLAEAVPMTVPKPRVEIPVFPAVPPGEPERLYPIVEPYAPPLEEIMVTEAAVETQATIKATGVFLRIKDLKGDIQHFDLFVLKLAQKYKPYGFLENIQVDGYSLIGAALQSGLKGFSKLELIRLLKSSYKVEPTAKDYKLAKQQKGLATSDIIRAVEQ